VIGNIEGQALWLFLVPVEQRKVYQNPTDENVAGSRITMTIRHLLVHLDKSEISAIRADVAIMLAKRLNAKLTALYAVCDPDVPGLASRNRYVFVERAAGKAEAAFRLHASSRGVDVDWSADIGANEVQVSRAVVLRAREMDLVVLGQSDPGSADGSVPHALIEHTVLHSGRPVLVIPYGGRFEALGRRVVVAWNASREASRAVHDAIPLLALAEEVTVLAMAPAGPRGRTTAPANSDALIRHLTEHGISASADRLVFDVSTIEPIDRLLSYLADSSADLLVMGAAGQQLGRAAAKRSLTGQVLAQMTLPILLSY
jgi:nucleotide-binding universal stress UspA family protein